MSADEGTRTQAASVPQERFARKNEGLDLKRAFELLDKNQDGKVDADELRAYCAGMSHKTKKVGWPPVPASRPAGALCEAGPADAASIALHPLPSGLTQTEVQDMIWEVDEDCDGCVNWEEFQAMFERCRDDKAGTEPRQLFNVVQFIIHDKENVGRVSLEEAMKITYLRVGRVRAGGWRVVDRWLADGCGGA